MRSEAFYSMIAQVIPTLLIALAVELVGIRRAAQAAGNMPDADEVQRRAASGDLPNDPVVILAALLGILVVIAEGCAVLVLLVGTETWFSVVAAPVCTLCVLVMTLFVAWIYWARLAQLSAGAKV
jgi:hypothetical protein